MRELTPTQIAMAVMGHPFSGATELELISLFNHEASHATAVDAVEPNHVPVALAA